MRMKMQSRKDLSMIQDSKPVTRIDFGDHYPEGGWGWTVVVAATVVYIICHGLHFAAGTLIINIRDTFKDRVELIDAGKSFRVYEE